MSKKQKKLLIVEVVAGKDLIAINEDSSDPYVLVSIGKEKFKTKVIRNTLNPLWGIGSQSERFIFEKAFSREKNLVLKVMDWDRFANDDRMGMISIPVSSITSDRDEWIPLSPQKSTDACQGELHLRISIVDAADLDFTFSGLWNAVKSGNVEQVKAELLNNFDATQKDPKTGESLLHIAVKTGDPEIVRSLIHSGVPVTSVDKEGNTPLHTFSRYFSVPSDLMQLFISKGAVIEAVNNYGETPLHHVVFNPSLKVVLAEQLLKNGANPNAQTHNKDTPLHYAVQLGRDDLAKLLLCYDADANIVGSKGAIPLTMAHGFENLFDVMRDTIDLSHHLEKIGLKKYLLTLANEDIFLYTFKNLEESKTFQKLIKDEQDRATLLASTKEIKILTKNARFFKNLKKQEELKKKESRVRVILSNTLEDSSWQIEFSDLEFLTLLGDGTSGAVYKGKFNGNTTCAIKVLKPVGSNWTKEVQEFTAEFGVALKVKSPNIVNFYGATLKQRLCLVMEFCGKGSLYSVLKDDSLKFDWSMSLRMLEEVVSGVLALHHHTPKILHRDLKTLNVLVTDDLTCKLCDFGLSRFDTQSNGITLQKCRGTYAYIAPEVYFNKGYFVQSDVYSVSIMIWEFVNRLIMGSYTRPYADINEISILHSAHNDGKRPDIPEGTPPVVQSLIEKTWDADYIHRLTSDQLLEGIRELQSEYEKSRSAWDQLVKNLVLQRKPRSKNLKIHGKE